MQDQSAVPGYPGTAPNAQDIDQVMIDTTENNNIANE